MNPMLLAIAGFSLFSLSDFILKIIGNSQHYQAAQLMFVTAAAAVIVNLIAMREEITAFGFRALASPFHQLLLVRGVCVALSYYCGVYAVTHIPLADFYSIYFIGPIFMVVAAKLWLRERPGRIACIALALAFCGMLLMMRPHFAERDALAYLAALAGTILNAGAQVFVRKIAQQESTAKIALYGWAVTLSLAFALIMVRPVDPMLWAAVGGLSLSGVIMALAALIVIEAFQRAPAARIAPFEYVMLVWGCLADMLYWQHLPTAWSLLGIALIIGAGHIMMRRKQAEDTDSAGAI